MIPIEVLNQFYNSVLQGMDDGLDLVANQYASSSWSYSTYLFTRRYELNHLLQSTRTMLVESNLDHLRCGVVDQHGTLIIIRELEQFLTKVIAKRIWKD